MALFGAAGFVGHDLTKGLARSVHMAQIPVVEPYCFIEVLKSLVDLTGLVGLAVGVDEYLRGSGHARLHGRILVGVADGQSQDRVDQAGQVKQVDQSFHVVDDTAQDDGSQAQ